MIEFFSNLLSQEFMPHGHCLFWRTGLLRLYIIGDGLTAIAYYSIPIAIAYFVYKRKDLTFKWIFVLFALFIILCGTTHIMFIWTLWNPVYRLEIVIKLLTAIVSIATAVLLWTIISKALALPSPTQLINANNKLTREINNHKRTEDQLKKLSLELEMKVEERTRNLVTVNRKRKDVEYKLKQIEWLLTKKPLARQTYLQESSYGDLTRLNTSRLIMDSVGKEILADIVGDYLDLLGTSSAVYEKDGSYALGIFTSSWCRNLDQFSRSRCGTTDNAEALKSGKWHCHESCWGNASKVSIEKGIPVEIECLGGIHLYAVPIMAGGELVGSINFGYGDPPKDPEKLQEIAELFGADVDGLVKEAKAYETRPPFIIDLAKKRLLSSARLIGEIVERKQAQNALQKARNELEVKVAKRTTELTKANASLKEKNRELEHFNELFIGREFRINELKEKVKELEGRLMIGE